MSEKLENGLDIETIIHSAYAAWGHAHAAAFGPSGPVFLAFENLSESETAGLIEAVAHVIAASETSEEQSFVKLAEAIYGKFADCNLSKHPGWAGISPHQRIVWEAVARHLANIINGEDDEVADLVAHEQEWAKWTAKTIQTRGAALNAF